MVPVDSLIPYARNARTHSEDQVAQIAASIAEFGFTNPILTDGDKGVIAGHGRLAAARKLALTQVPVIELGHSPSGSVFVGGNIWSKAGNRGKATLTDQHLLNTPAEALDLWGRFMAPTGLSGGTSSLLFMGRLSLSLASRQLGRRWRRTRRAVGTSRPTNPWAPVAEHRQSRGLLT